MTGNFGTCTLYAHVHAVFINMIQYTPSSGLTVNTQYYVLTRLVGRAHYQRHFSFLIKNYALDPNHKYSCLHVQVGTVYTVIQRLAYPISLAQSGWWEEHVQPFGQSRSGTEALSGGGAQRTREGK